jgi:hypothetical protein
MSLWVDDARGLTESAKTLLEVLIVASAVLAPLIKKL